MRNEKENKGCGHSGPIDNPICQWERSLPWLLYSMYILGLEACAPRGGMHFYYSITICEYNPYFAIIPFIEAREHDP